MLFLDTAQLATQGNSFFPIILMILIAMTFVALLMVLTHLLGPKRKTSDKLVNFESGIPSLGNARKPMAVKYFLVAILFVLFDVEIIFFYPYAVNFKVLGMDAFYAVLMFIGLFLCGFIYVIRKGALKWDD